MSHVKRGFKQTAAGLSETQSQENEDMSVWVGVENALGKVCNLWGYLDHKRNLKSIQNFVGDLYLVGVLLTNIHTCKYGSQLREYYCELPPSMEAYFQLHGHSLG
ncbi:unnamed protein product [Discosporangium mesarthrocarpum]